jgi:hypothetical protein
LFLLYNQAAAAAEYMALLLFVMRINTVERIISQAFTEFQCDFLSEKRLYHKISKRKQLQAKTCSCAFFIVYSLFSE